jgi:hypothetical protein
MSDYAGYAAGDADSKNKREKKTILLRDVKEKSGAMSLLPVLKRGTV